MRIATKNRNSAGFSHIELFIAIIIVGIIAFIGYRVLNISHADSLQGPITGIAGKCLDNYNSRASNGNAIVLYTCNGTDAQQWTVKSNGAIVNKNGYCLDVYASRKAVGSRVNLWQCNGTAAQIWKVDRKTGTIINPNSNLCLDDRYSNTSDGNQIWMYTCNGTLAQKWTIPAQSTTSTSGGATTSTSGGTTTTTTPTPTTSSSLTPSGQAMPVGDLAGWRQVFADDFPTNVPVGGFSNCQASTFNCSGLPSSVASKWWAYPDYWKDTSKNGTYMPSKVMSISNGVMNMNLHTSDGLHMVSTPFPKISGANDAGGMLYGRYAIRFKADPVPGYKTAWLLWPDSYTWPRDGEIDFPEGNLNSTIGAFMHHQGATSGGDQDAFGSSVTYTSWHTAVLEWLPNSVKFILDGKTIGTSTSRIPNTSMHWVLQTETQLGGGAPSSSAAGNVQIDWVAIYAKN